MIFKLRLDTGYDFTSSLPNESSSPVLHFLSPVVSKTWYAWRHTEWNSVCAVRFLSSFFIFSDKHLLNVRNDEKISDHNFNKLFFLFRSHQSFGRAGKQTTPTITFVLRPGSPFSLSTPTTSVLAHLDINFVLCLDALSNTIQPAHSSQQQQHFLLRVL